MKPSFNEIITQYREEGGFGKWKGITQEVMIKEVFDKLRKQIIENYEKRDETLHMSQV